MVKEQIKSNSCEVLWWDPLSKSQSCSPVITKIKVLNQTRTFHPRPQCNTHGAVGVLHNTTLPLVEGRKRSPIFIPPTITVAAEQTDWIRCWKVLLCGILRLCPVMSPSMGILPPILFLFILSSECVLHTDALADACRVCIPSLGAVMTPAT